MSATVCSDSMVISATESQPVASKAATTQTEVESARCDCCGLTEECTLAYIDRVRERYHGKWICGLCSEAVKDEIVRCESLISTEEAVTQHMNFCKKLEPPSNPTVHLISAIKHLLRRSLDSPRSIRSLPSSPMNRRAVLSRSESCFPTLVNSSSRHEKNEGKD
ncbi:uncharacterized protein LOC132284761 [Cornus florida]|uniref:uncharacterized protein LOC132284761 n=1 Tax=Cornus florida TaxID=4283 RepID=UPI0028995192|nr:uncharacterized protein LOC132284761 [Cornus florida]